MPYCQLEVTAVRVGCIVQLRSVDMCQIDFNAVQYMYPVSVIWADNMTD